jgi:hypothetical protein
LREIRNFHGMETFWRSFPQHGKSYPRHGKLFPRRGSSGFLGAIWGEEAEEVGGVGGEGRNIQYPIFNIQYPREQPESRLTGLQDYQDYQDLQPRAQRGFGWAMRRDAGGAEGEDQIGKETGFARGCLWRPTDSGHSHSGGRPLWGGYLSSYQRKSSPRRTVLAMAASLAGVSVVAPPTENPRVAMPQNPNVSPTMPLSARSP